MRLLLLLLLCAACREASGQESNPTFKADVNWVRVDVEVLKGATAVTGLTAEDFTVKDNGKAVSILKVIREEAALDLVLLFDMSGSMKEGVTETTTSARAALAQLKKGDRVMVAGFNDSFIPILPFAEDFGEVEQAIRFGIVAQPFRGATQLHSSIMKSAKLLAREPLTGRRRAILVITDNQGDRGYDEDEVIERLWRTDTVLCGLRLEPDRSDRKRPGVEKAAATSGCEMREARNPSQDFEAMMKRLRNRYVVYYAMPEGQPGEKREIEVALSRPSRQRIGEVRILARRGYLLPGGATE